MFHVAGHVIESMAILEIKKNCCCLLPPQPGVIRPVQFVKIEIDGNVPPSPQTHIQKKKNRKQT